MKRVFIAQHPTEAHFVKGLLENQGIPAEVQGEALFGARGETPVTPDTLPSVWVTNDSQIEEALEVLRTREISGTTGKAWRCPACGEEIEPQFTTCWRCGADKA